MIKISKETSESFISQLKAKPDRPDAMLANIFNENPEFIDGMREAFVLYHNLGGRDKLPVEMTALLADSSLLFATLAYNIINAQHEADIMNQE
jgi:hypothetical protein